MYKSNFRVRLVDLETMVCQVHEVMMVHLDLLVGLEYLDLTELQGLKESLAYLGLEDLEKEVPKVTAGSLDYLVLPA